MQADVQDKAAEATLAAIERFNIAFGDHDVDAIMAHMTDDCIFESTYPPPDGIRYQGQEVVRGVWNELFTASPDARFDAEEIVAAGDRCTVRWIYRYTDGSGQEQHLRGVDVFRVRDGKVAEKLSYVKG